jgi:methylthioribose-1-phosphate isomerase
MVETIQWTDEGVVMIDQTRLPRETVFITCKTYQEVAEAIRSMVIRGAPAIGVAAAMGVALGVAQADERDLDAQFQAISKTLAATRPTAVNLFWAIDRMKQTFEASRGLPLGQLRKRLIEEAQQIRLEDIAINHAIGSRAGRHPLGDFRRQEDRRVRR